MSGFNGFKAPKVPSSDASGGEVLLGCLFALVLFVVIVVLFALLTQFAWNVGVVALVAACGGSVAKIGFWTAVAVNIALGIIARIFKGTPAKADA